MTSGIAPFPDLHALGPAMERCLQVSAPPKGVRPSPPRRVIFEGFVYSRAFL